MEHKLERLNSRLSEAIGTIIIKLLPDASTTVRDVLMDETLKTAKVYLNCDRKGLTKVEKNRVKIQNDLKSYVKLRYTPVLKFIIDDNSLDTIDELFAKIDNENKGL